MSNQMNKNARNWLILITLVVVDRASNAVGLNHYLVSNIPFELHQGPPRDILGDIELFYTIKTVVSTINVTLLIFLLLTYINIYRKTRSEFTIGLIIFSSVFLLNALASNPFVIWIFGFRPFGLGPFAMLPDLFTLAALGVLLYLSIKY